MGRTCDRCHSKMPKFTPRKRVGDDLCCDACASGRPGGGNTQASRTAVSGEHIKKLCQVCSRKWDGSDPIERCPTCDVRLLTINDEPGPDPSKMGRPPCSHPYASTEEIGGGRVQWYCPDCNRTWMDHTDHWGSKTAGWRIMLAEGLSPKVYPTQELAEAEAARLGGQAFYERFDERGLPMGRDAPPRAASRIAAWEDLDGKGYVFEDDATDTWVLVGKQAGESTWRYHGRVHGNVVVESGFSTRDEAKAAAQKMIDFPWFTGSRRVAHDSGDGATIMHCPFCGGGNVVARSDGTAWCEFCSNAFTVQVQPEHNSMPQSVDGQPFDMPDMPGEPAAAREEPMPGPGFISAKNAWRTDTGVGLSTEDYIAHLAIKHAGDQRERVVGAVRTARRRT